MFSKGRLDTLSDGIFGVSMTLLILDVRLPDDSSPATAPISCRASPVCGPSSCRIY
jgi:uncharacterized membrane protein